eukprot:7550981-Pyramimonas_sp.AAC.1
MHRARGFCGERPARGVQLLPLFHLLCVDCPARSQPRRVWRALRWPLRPRQPRGAMRITLIAVIAIARANLLARGRHSLTW